MNKTMRAYRRWAEEAGDRRARGFQPYVQGIAEARYVIRRVTRMVDEQARSRGLEPLQHQTLLQVYGVDQGRGVEVSRLAARLDVAVPHASRLATQLEGLGLVHREVSSRDRRVTSVRTTRAGVDLLRDVDDAVHQKVAAFQAQLSDAERFSALSIFAFYVGLEPTTSVAEAIRTSEI